MNEARRASERIQPSEPQLSCACNLLVGVLLAASSFHSALSNYRRPPSSADPRTRMGHGASLRRRRGHTTLLLAAVTVGCAAATVSSDCPILRPIEPFLPRAVRKQADEWTADIFLTQWVADAVLTIVWPGPRELISANHADVRETEATSATIALQDAGPDDDHRVMLHVKGSQPAVPTIRCTLPPGTIIETVVPAAAPQVHVDETYGLNLDDAGEPYRYRPTEPSAAPHRTAPMPISSTSHGVTATTLETSNGGLAWSA